MAQRHDGSQRAPVACRSWQLRDWRLVRRPRCRRCRSPWGRSGLGRSILGSLRDQRSRRIYGRLGHLTLTRLRLRRHGQIRNSRRSHRLRRNNRINEDHRWAYRNNHDRFGRNSRRGLGLLFRSGYRLGIRRWDTYLNLRWLRLRYRFRGR